MEIRRLVRDLLIFLFSIGLLALAFTELRGMNPDAAISLLLAIVMLTGGIAVTAMIHENIRKDNEEDRLEKEKQQQGSKENN